MKTFTNGIKRFFAEEDAPTMVEYGLLVALIAIVVAVGAAILGLAINNLFGNVAGKVEP